MPSRVLLSLGSNIGNSRENIRVAMTAIERDILTNTTRSSLWLTEPVGYTAQPDFINAAIVGFSHLTCVQIRDRCKEIESELGRAQRERWREREIDIDVILVGDEIIDEDDLHVPHARMEERRFVLAPCNEVAPDMISPRSKKSIAELLFRCTDNSSVMIDQ
ncbi:MAG: 2-amino-4-hydroxy-6-hydroxymethyldihydropteridine diphosphokinase [Candidatus Kapabacteria bacterium]|nr:2-amino-4-hydroxy-6-hydroxymethyldihydropteridine diphosphokinase [Candidatus Kapabacteria bacterium]